MDPRERADAVLARARARGAFVVTPESAVSPMDAASTLQIPRAVVSAADDRDEDSETTMVVPGSRVGGRRRQQENELPAIAQEALTDVVTPRTQGKRRPVAPRPPREMPEQVPPPDTVTLPIGQEPAPEPEPAPAPEPEPVPAQEPEAVDGLIPTVKQPPTTRSTLSQRLDG
jgi:hypothetical protein